MRLTRRLLAVTTAAISLSVLTGAAFAQDKIKIGSVLTITGPAALSLIHI